MPKVVAGYKDAAKARIVQAAVDVFTTRGFDAATMDEVARQVGVSKAALYRYFPSKNALLEEVFAGTQKWMRQQLEKAVEGRTFREGVRVLFELLERSYGTASDVALEWFAEAHRNDRVRRLMRADGERDVRTIAAFLEGQRKKGRLSSRMNSRLLAQILETAFIGAWVRLAVGHDRESVIRSLEELVSNLEIPR